MLLWQRKRREGSLSRALWSADIQCFRLIRSSSIGSATVTPSRVQKTIDETHSVRNVFDGESRKGRSCPFWHDQKGPAAKNLSNPCDSNREAARSHAQARAWASGVDCLVSEGHSTSGASPSASLYRRMSRGFSVDKRWGVPSPQPPALRN